METVSEDKLKPCEYCGGVRSEVNSLEAANQIDEISRCVEEIRDFVLGDFSGMITVFDASRILGVQCDDLEKECRKESREQLKGVKDDRYFQIRGGKINVLRYKPDPKVNWNDFMVERISCVRYARKFGPLVM